MHKCGYDFCEVMIAGSRIFCTTKCEKEDALLRDFIDDDPVIREAIPAVASEYPKITPIVYQSDVPQHLDLLDDDCQCPQCQLN